jgi:hypothetical protein
LKKILMNSENCFFQSFSLLAPLSIFNLYRTEIL